MITNDNGKLKIIFYSAKEYEKNVFMPLLDQYGYEAKFIQNKLFADSAVFSFGCDVASIFTSDRVDKDTIDELKEAGVKLLALRCAGYNNVDIEYARGKIGIVRVPAYSPEAIAEYAMALTLGIIRNTHRAYFRTKDYNFDISSLMGFNICGKTIGVLGEGKIGRAYINICKGFGAKILVSTPHPANIEGVKYVSVDDLLKNSDIISLHCPLTKETNHIIGRKQIETMKDGVVIINTARGALIDTSALIEGIKSGKIRGAGIDVYENEDNVFMKDYSSEIMVDDTLSRLISFPNVIVSSHQAFYTLEAIEAIAKITINNIKEYMTYGKAENEIK